MKAELHALIRSKMNTTKLDHFKTFEEWGKRGFYIRKGCKSYTRNDKGECLFSPNQVEREFIKDDWSGASSAHEGINHGSEMGMYYGM